jgi:hypothetical protein
MRMHPDGKARMSDASVCALLQNCNVQLIDTANGNLVYDFKNGNRGTPPCRLQVLNTGSFVVVDSLNVVWSVNGSPAQPSAGNFTMATGQSLPQVCAILARGSWASPSFYTVLC